MNGPAIVTLTPGGRELARRLAASAVGGDIVAADGSARRVLTELFQQGRPLVCVIALGIVVRLLGPLTADKDADPPVVVVDEAGRFAISVLGGHRAGANDLTAAYLREQGAERITASYDLNREQLLDLVAASDPGWLEVVIHQHMPMFHMEHCVFCAFLSTGKDYRDCGRPCDKHRVALRDRVGAELPLRADAGCRNTVFNNRAQTGAEYVSRLIELGACHFRVEFVNEGADEVARTLARYCQLLRGEITGSELWRELKLINQLGVTRGQMETAPATIHRKV